MGHESDVNSSFMGKRGGGSGGIGGRGVERGGRRWVRGRKFGGAYNKVSLVFLSSFFLPLCSHVHPTLYSNPNPTISNLKDCPSESFHMR
jgi:hypothetical protein